MGAAVQALEDRFLVEREEGTVFVMPFVRDVAEQEWTKKGVPNPHHRAAADYYGRLASDGSVVRRYQARTEAIFPSYRGMRLQTCAGVRVRLGTSCGCGARRALAETCISAVPGDMRGYSAREGRGPEHARKARALPGPHARLERGARDD